MSDENERQTSTEQDSRQPRPPNPRRSKRLKTKSKPEGPACCARWPKPKISAAAPNARRPKPAQYAVTKFARDMLAHRRQFRPRAGRLPAGGARRRRSAGQGRDGRRRGHRPPIAATLGTHGVKPSIPTDGKFDPNLHQAIAEVPGNGKPAGSIVDVVQTGYMIGDRLLRPAMVTVARKDGGNGTAPGGSVDTRV